MKRIFKVWPIILLLLLNIVLFVANYKPGTFLTGWDNLHTEFWPSMNFQRAFFGAWQEYQSLGLLGGMGHASDIVRQLYVWFLTVVLPLSLVRYVSTFTMLFLGGVGTYSLANYILLKRTARPLASELNADTDKNSDLPSTGIGRRSLSEERDSHENKKRLAERHLATWVGGEQMLSFLASLFYTLNIGTIQTFYVPFEAFIYHFAALPWLLLSSILFLKDPSFKHLVFLAVVLFLSTPASYIPTLFLVFILAISIYVAVTFLFTQKGEFLIRTIKLFIIIFLINAFWLLPFLFFTVKNSSITVNAKMNQMATETVFAQNKEFGTLLDTALLRGFWFNNVDPNLEGDFTYMMAPWRDHFSNPKVPASGLALFAIVLIGAACVVWRLIINHKSLIINHQFAFAVLFLFSFTMLAIDTPPFSWANELFRKFPLFDQVFRFPFTKFNTLAALTYSIMLALGISFIFERIRNYELRIMRFLPYSLFIILASAILWIASPVFSGHLFYGKAQISIPQDYLETFEFFKKQDTTARIANLPQPTFWGWTLYRWGYGGSGFIWYGIKQPILDRAFDVWSESSENYYFELTQALYSKDIKAFEDVLNKYQIAFLLLDKNVIYPNSPKSLYYDETENLLSVIPSIQKAAEFGEISIYKVNLQDKPSSFVFASPVNLPSIQTPSWSTRDIAYSTFGNYISVSCQLSVVSCQIYPFGSLFSAKTVGEQDFDLASHGDLIEISKAVSLKDEYQLKIPLYFNNEKSIALEIYLSLDEKDNTVISTILKTPEILIDKKKAWGESLEIPLFIIPKGATFPISLNINGASTFKIYSAPIGEKGKIGTGFLTALQNNSVVLSSPQLSKTQIIPRHIFDNLFSKIGNSIALPPGAHEITVRIPKINDSYLSYTPILSDATFKNCNNSRLGREDKSFSEGNLTLSTKNSSLCLSFFSPTLPHDEGYAIFIKSANTSGLPLHLWILNEDQQSSPIDTYLRRNHDLSFFVLPPMEQNGRGYSIHFDNVSIGRQETVNQLSYLEIHPIPYRFITNLFLVLKNPAAQSTLPPTRVENVSHPNESLYILKLSQTDSPTTLVLSQSYDPGWRAYEVQSSKFKVQSFLSYALPFAFGKEIKTHVKVNGWENGWLIGNWKLEIGNSTIVVVYLPQYLEYFGFVILIVIGGILIFGSLSYLSKRESYNRPRS